VTLNLPETSVVKSRPSVTHGADLFFMSYTELCFTAYVANNLHRIAIKNTYKLL